MNLTHNEDSSLDIEHKWYKETCFFNLKRGHDELGTTRFEFALDHDEIESLIAYLTYTLIHKE